MYAVKPVSYPGRTPHIHVAVSQKGKRMLTSQVYIKGEPKNERDGLYARVPKKLRDKVTIDFAPIKGSDAAEFAAHWDIVIGVTPEG